MSNWQEETAREAAFDLLHSLFSVWIHVDDPSVQTTERCLLGAMQAQAQRTREETLAEVKMRCYGTHKIQVPYDSRQHDDIHAAFVTCAGCPDCAALREVNNV